MCFSVNLMDVDRISLVLMDVGWFSCDFDAILMDFGNIGHPMAKTNKTSKMNKIGLRLKCIYIYIYIYIYIRV